MPEHRPSERANLPPRRLAALLLTTLVLAMPTAQAAGSRDEAIAEALNQVGGGDARVLGVTERTESSGRRVYEVKIISDGRVRVVTVTAD